MLLILVAVAVLAFTAGSLFKPPTVNASRSHRQVLEVSRDAEPNHGLDAYGNEVTHAVAEYSLDPAGSLYERHAPEIELPHLGSPKS